MTQLSCFYASFYLFSLDCFELLFLSSNFSCLVSQVIYISPVGANAIVGAMTFSHRGVGD